MISFFKKKKSDLSFLEESKKSFWEKLKNFILPQKNVITPELISDLEELLISLDLGLETSDKFLSEVTKKLNSMKEISDEELGKILESVAIDIVPNYNFTNSEKYCPQVTVLVGINGAGKTTSAAKLAYRYKSENKKCLLVAGDTFRAAAVQQLEEWAKKVGVDIFSKPNTPPSAVIFDGVKKGIEEKYDIIIIDTSGRLHTKTPLMEELSKICRTVEKILLRKPDDVLLVIDGTTGQNVIDQSDGFIKSSNATGFIVTKLDGTSKGGMVVNLSSKYGIPIKYLGIGEKIDDLIPFEKEEFFKNFFSKN